MSQRNLTKNLPGNKITAFTNARYFDPALGRWTQQDALADSLGNPKSLKRYAHIGCEPNDGIDSSVLRGP